VHLQNLHEGFFRCHFHGITLFERLLKSFAALLSVPEFFTEYFRQFTLEEAKERAVAPSFGSRLVVARTTRGSASMSANLAS